MMDGTRNIKLAVLLLGDIAAAYFALWATLFIRYRGANIQEHWSNHAMPFTLVFFSWVIIFYIVGLYEMRGLRNRIDLISKIGEAIGASFFLSLAVFYLVPFFRIAPKTNLVITISIFTVLFLFWRLVTMHLFSKHKLRLNLIFLGNAPEIEDVKKTLMNNPHFGYALQGHLNELPKNGELPEADVIVVSHLLPENDQLTRALYKRFFASTVVIDFPSFFEEVYRSAPESAMDKQWVMNNISRRHVSIYEILKRPLDILLSLTLSVPAIFLTPFIALAIRFEDGGSIFFQQLRVGKNGQNFTMLKFRTMSEDAEKNGAAFAAINDKRITRVGGFLRTTRLDELPQVWNILLGDMSFVGPRPERPEMEKVLSEIIPLFPVRRIVRPGLTGWAQINASYASDPDDHRKKLRHDLYYMKHRSLALDSAIVLRTIYSVLKRMGR